MFQYDFSLFFNLVSRFQEVHAPLICWQIALGSREQRGLRDVRAFKTSSCSGSERNISIVHCQLKISKSRYWWKMSKWRKTGSRNDHKEMFQTMKRERTIHLGIKSEEDVCTSWEIIFEILYLYGIFYIIKCVSLFTFYRFQAIKFYILLFILWHWNR